MSYLFFFIAVIVFYKIVTKKLIGALFLVLGLICLTSIPIIGIPLLILGLFL